MSGRKTAARRQTISLSRVQSNLLELPRREMEEQSSIATAGLLTRSVCDAFPTRKSVARECRTRSLPEEGSRNIQQRELFGSCTRFPILLQGPTGPEALKPLFTFRFILPQPIGNVNKQPSRKTGLLRKNAVFMLSAPPTASEEAGTGPGPPRRGRPCCPYPPLAG